MKHTKHIVMTVMVACGFMFLGTACGEKKDTGKDVAIQFLQKQVSDEQKKNAAFEVYHRCREDAPNATEKARCTLGTW